MDVGAVMVVVVEVVGGGMIMRDKLGPCVSPLVIGHLVSHRGAQQLQRCVALCDVRKNISCAASEATRNKR